MKILDTGFSRSREMKHGKTALLYWKMKMLLRMSVIDTFHREMMAWDLVAKEST